LLIVDSWLLIESAVEEEFFNHQSTIINQQFF